MKYLIFPIVFFVLLLGSRNAQAADIQAGEALFKANCRACHNLDMRLVGPALKGVQDRRSEEWMLQFVKNSTAMIEAGDSVAVSLFKEYNQIPMPPQPLDDTQIRDVIAYIADASIAKPDNNPIKRPEVTNPSNVRPLKFSDFRFWITFTITIVLLILGVYYKAETEALRKRVLEPEK